MKLKVMKSLIQSGYLVGLDNGFTFTIKSKVKDTLKEANDLCAKWTKDIEYGLIPNYEVL